MSKQNKLELIKKLIDEGHTNDQIVETFLTQFSDWKRSSVERTVRAVRNPPAPKRKGKKAVTPQHGWEAIVKHIQDTQEFYKTQKEAADEKMTITIDTKEPICILTVSDLHLGAKGTDYQAFVQLTKEIQETPNLYVILVGDLLEMAIKLRGVAEVMGNIILPKTQVVLLDLWLKSIAHKVLFASWDNHSDERMENTIGYSAQAQTLAKYTKYFAGIGHADVKVGNEIYKFAVSHQFRGSSHLNPTHAQMRYMRFEGIDREICISGDTHKPGMIKYNDGANIRVAINTGSLHTDSSYAKRYFSLFTQKVFPCLVLHPDEHLATPYWSLREAILGGFNNVPQHKSV